MINMSLKKKPRALSVILTIVTIATVVFIFSQSLLPGKVSSDESGRVLRLLNGILETLGLYPFLNHSLVRTAAHFSEFAFLGASIFFTVLSYGRKHIHSLIIALPSSLLVACCDECIQLFTKDRAFQFTDILTDFSGAFLAVFLIFVPFFVIDIIKRKRRNRNE